MLLSLPALNPARAAYIRGDTTPGCFCLKPHVSEELRYTDVSEELRHARLRPEKEEDGFQRATTGVRASGGEGVYREVARLSEGTAMFIQNDAYVGGFFVLGGSGFPRKHDTLVFFANTCRLSTFPAR
jgi:hypothetical protein